MAQAGAGDASQSRNDGPRVSILIPTFNRPDFLAGAVESALSQTAGDLEVVVGDDGQDGAAVVESFGDRRLRYQRNPSRLGVALNWQALIDSARGRFLALLMDDDRLEPSFVARCLREFERDPSLGVVCTNHTFARGDHLTVRDCGLAPGRYDDFAEQLLRSRAVAVSAALWKAETWRDVRPLPDTAAADVVLFARIADLGHPFFYIDEPLMRYGVHGANFSAGIGFRDDCVRAWEELSFRNERAQRERDRYLANALISRAEGALTSGDLAGARADAARAASLAPGRRLRTSLIGVAASNTTLATATRRLSKVRTVKRAFQRL